MISNITSAADVSPVVSAGQSAGSGAAQGAIAGASMGGVPGAVIGGALGLVTSALGASAAEDAAKQAWRNNVYMASHKYQLLLEDLKNAKLNPALAITGGAIPSNVQAPVADTSAYNAATHAASNMGGQIASAAQADRLTSIAEAKLSGELKIQAMQAAKIEQDIATSAATASQMAANTRLLEQQLPRLQQEIVNLSVDEQIKRAELAQRDWDLKSAPATFEAKQYAVKQVLTNIALAQAQAYNQYKQGDAAGLGHIGANLNGLVRLGKQAGLPLEEVFDVMRPAFEPLGKLPQIYNYLQGEAKTLWNRYRIDVSNPFSRPGTFPSPIRVVPER